MKKYTRLNVFLKNLEKDAVQNIIVMFICLIFLWFTIFYFKKQNQIIYATLVLATILYCVYIFKNTHKAFVSISKSEYVKFLAYNKKFLLKTQIELKEQILDLLKIIQSVSKNKLEVAESFLMVSNFLDKVNALSNNYEDMKKHLIETERYESVVELDRIKNLTRKDKEELVSIQVQMEEEILKQESESGSLIEVLNHFKNKSSEIQTEIDWISNKLKQLKWFI